MRRGKWLHMRTAIADNGSGRWLVYEFSALPYLVSGQRAAWQRGTESRVGQREKYIVVEEAIVLTQARRVVDRHNALHFQAVS
jgi:hypothetical protein